MEFMCFLALAMGVAFVSGVVLTWLFFRGRKLVTIVKESESKVTKVVELDFDMEAQAKGIRVYYTFGRGPGPGKLHRRCEA